jgi:3,4-dihydroxy 2-butanone 4-phosphate synthase
MCFSQIPKPSTTGSISRLDAVLQQRVAAAVDAIRAGIPVLLTDDDGRENEADFIVAAERLSQSTMAQMIRDGSGIVCLCLTDPDIERLDLPQMVQDNQSAYQTAFTVSIEARLGVSTGVSAQDRLTTIQVAIHPEAVAEDLVRPGHVFPLRAHPDGLRARQGHTEAAIYLVQLAGLSPMAVLSELMNPDGSMARGNAVSAYAHKHQLPMLSIAELLRVNQLAIRV